jgi:hypothetical protein
MRSWLDLVDDTDLPILSSLVDALRYDGAVPDVEEPWEPADAPAGVAPTPVPLESLQSLPAARMM